MTLLLVAATIGLAPAAHPTPVRKVRTEPVAAATTTTVPPMILYWPLAWLDGTPTRPHGIPALSHLAGDDVAIVPPPEVFDEPAAPALPPPAALTASAAVPPSSGGGGVWAVVIGINDYPGRRSDLRAATADATDVDRVLSRFGVPGHQRLLLRDGQASAEMIKAALDWLVAHAGPESTAVLFYAGHVRELSRTTEAIVAADGGLVTDADVAAHLAPLRAARTWLAFASCYGGGFDEVLAPGRVLTGAADGDSLAYENQAYNRSYFGEYLVRRGLLEGRADRSIQQAFGWAEAELRRDHPGRVPIMVDRAGGEVTLGTPPTAAAPRAPEPAPAQAEESSPPSTTTTTEPERRCALRFGTLVGCRDD